MTNTSVVLGDGTPEGGWDEGALACASTDAAEGHTSERERVVSWFTSIQFVLASRSPI
jgi:hypothetical protein